MIRIDGTRLRDAHGREVILRGVNLGGDSKLPYPDGGTHVPTDFADHRTVSFVGRPFPLEEAPRHFERLAHWGFNCLRLLTTWEAVEHEGPGRYDTAYLDYFAQIARSAGDYGFHVFVDFHQDVWSRMSGGDGAPGWVFDAVGLDFRRFQQADAAVVMQAAIDWSNPSPHQPSFPDMIWSSNYLMPANGIMWTLFWLGRHATPDFLIDGVNVQDYLQRHYLDAVGQVAARLAGMPHVVGFDTLNEPGIGWAGIALSRVAHDGDVPSPLPQKPGPLWTPLAALAAAQGRTVELPMIARTDRGDYVAEGSLRANADGVRIWRDDAACPFERAGIYRLGADGTAEALREDAFTRIDGRPLSIAEDCYAPFYARVAETVRAVRADWLLFAETDPYAVLTERDFPQAMPRDWVDASHWYDIALLYRKSVQPELAQDFLTGQIDHDTAGMAARYARQLGLYAKRARRHGVPCLIGEFGIPYDLDRGRAYRAWAAGSRDPDDWADQVLALTLAYDALDAHLLHATQWNYTATNRNDPWIGDGWNQEDLSIWSQDQCDDPGDPDSGARALAGFCRPYVRAAQGTLTAMRREADGCFTASVDADTRIAAPTEVFVPRATFSGELSVEVGDPSARIERDGQLLLVHAGRDGPIDIRVSPVRNG